MFPSLKKKEKKEKREGSINIKRDYKDWVYIWFLVIIKGIYDKLYERTLQKDNLNEGIFPFYNY